MRDLLSAVSYMHAQKVVHRDIKLENIKFSKKCVVDHIKILDFGSACHFDTNSNTLMYDMCGSPYYVAPEMVAGSGYNELVDVWSCGIIFHFLLTGAFPFDAKTDIEIMHLIQKSEVNFIGKRYKDIDYVSLQLLKMLLTKDPHTRVSAARARQHPYFKYDDLDQEIIREGLIDCRDFIKFGPIQLTFLRFFVDRLSTSKVIRMNRKLFFYLNTSCSGSITKDELY